MSLTQTYPLSIRGYTEPALTTPAGFPGANEDLHARRRVYKNANRVAAVKKIVVDAATDGYTYTNYLNGIAVNFTAGVGTTKILIAAGIAAAINGNTYPENNRVEAVSDGIDTITITGLQAGEDFELYTLQTTKMTVSVVTAASNASALNFGLLVCRNSSGEGVQVPAPVAAVAQVYYATPAAEDSKEYNLGVQIADGREYIASFTSGGGGATVKQIVEGITTQLNAMLPASTVVATEDDTKVILTSEVAGTAFTPTAGAAGNTGVWTLTEHTANVEAGFTLAFAGVVEFRNLTPTGDIQADEAFDVLNESNRVWLTPEGAPSTITDTIYCRHTVDTIQSAWEPGRILFNSASGKAVALDSSTIELLSTTVDSSGRYPFRINNIRAA